METNRDYAEHKGRKPGPRAIIDNNDNSRWFKTDPLTARLLCRSCWNSAHSGCIGDPCQCYCSDLGRRKRRLFNQDSDKDQLLISMKDCLLIGPRS